ncbi:MAG: DEAD/DEAH box helicase [Rhodobacteraceae bacterium]|nr:DEAD/DEAH box helicase [Paracoccaceae bacterium]
MKQALADALQARGYDKLTPVQEAVTEPEIGDADLLVSAQTGSGKTVGFGLAIAPTLLGEAEKFSKASSPLALIIAPTRELALQVKRELAWLYAQTGAVVASCVGGMDMRDERRALARGAHIVVATPGRLRDHIMRGSLEMGTLRAVVLDEADEMLDLGFREDLEFILGEAPDQRRTLMFSATVPRAIATLAKSYQKNAVRVTTLAEKSQHTDITYRAMNVSVRDGENAIINVLRYYEAPNALVFCNTRAMVNRLTTRLLNRGFAVVALSGELSQNERTHALQAMRDGRARVCVATDVAARGIDLPSLDLVVHAELPSSHETLLHRSGRTGRAGRKGVSALIVPPKARRKSERILKSAKVEAQWCEAPSATEVRVRDQQRILEDATWLQQITDSEITPVQNLVNSFSVDQIAAAYLRLYTAKHSAPEELSPAGSDGPPKPRANFGGSVWFSISGGRKNRAEPRRILPMLCKAGNISKEDIGAIRVADTESYVEISKGSVKTFLAAIGKNMRLEGGIVTQLDNPPALANTPRPSFSARQRDRKPPRGKPKTKSDSAPIDWDDAPTPRKKKPKNTSAPTPAGKPNSKKNKARRAKAAADQKIPSGKGRKKP